MGRNFIWKRNVALAYNVSRLCDVAEKNTPKTLN